MTTLYLTEPGTVVRLQNQSLLIQRQGRQQHQRLAELTLVVVLPGVQLTHGALAALLDGGTETLFLTQSGQFRGRLQGAFPSNPGLRLAQYQTVDTHFGLALAQRWVRGKVQNQRCLLQRRHRATQGRLAELGEAIDSLAAQGLALADRETARDRDQLMGLEGACARCYYQGLRHWFEPVWRFQGRNRRPPLDPINALLSWGYGVLLARVFSATVQAGLDPYLGFLHALEPYRPNLALDLMEEFRPVVVDQAVIAVVQASLISPADFEPSPEGAGIWVGPVGKKLFLAELERQLRQPLLYPPQGRRLTVAQIILEQARWVGRCLVARQLDYEPFTLR